MKTKIMINGMHCNACVSLIKMELEENGLNKRISSIEVLDNNQGELILQNLNESELTSIKEIINSMDDYQIEE
jgi:copper chaperone CopZ